MDELLREFLTETGESLNLVDVQLVRFEQEPNNIKILENIFRLVHTIKGTCGFLGLPRLEALTHAAETLMSNFRGGNPVTTDAVSLVLATIDRIKALLDELERHQGEPQGNDGDLIARLQHMASKVMAAKDMAAKDMAAGGVAAAAATSFASPAPEQLVRPDEIAFSTIAGAVRDVESTDAPRAPSSAQLKFAATRSVPAAAPPDPIGTEEDRPDGKIAS